MSKPSAARFLRQSLLGLLGPLVWSVHLAVVYGAAHIGCALDSPALVRFIVGLATLLCLAILFVAVVMPGRLWRQAIVGGPELADDTRRFLAGMMRLLAVLSVLGIAWAGASIGFLTPCVR